MVTYTGFRDTALCGFAISVAVLLGAGVVSVSLLAAPVAYAGCPEGQMYDSVSRMCWSQTGQGQSYGGPGDGPCLPGRVGGCIGSLQQGSAIYITVPGATTWP